MDKKQKTMYTSTPPQNCPHCGHPLTMWEQVLLSVDRMLICRNCWYRIILEVRPEEPDDTQNTNLRES